jgi:anti-anti-sigma factor
VEDLVEKHKTVVLNLECVDKIDASAIGTIAACVRCAIDHGSTIRCFGAKKQVRQLLEVTRLASFIKFYNTEKEAVTAVNAIAA